MADVANGRVEQPTENVVGSRAAFHCDPGYFLTGRPEVTCQGRGKWDGEPPTCEKG
ncbi:hypothetical protein DPMN_146183 [Dreissena polymorpha]|nr:hypothetical protein DPMN_146183 [Dreissena polymorpha]